ncbi:flagellar hook-basal body complex protein FliE [Kordiimonas gwangyangensis]|nr:flagellar hook-basal body complex protein FliE [Kordiimonas gwangyangensis]
MVTAVSNAEMVVDTVISVRDKVISAYNDILKMPI